MPESTRVRPSAIVPADQDTVEPLAVPRVEPRGLWLAQALGVRDAGRVLRHFVAYLPTQLIPAVAGFLVLPVLARELAPTQLGVLTLAPTPRGVLTTAQTLTTLG